MIKLSLRFHRGILHQYFTAHENGFSSYKSLWQTPSLPVSNSINLRHSIKILLLLLTNVQPTFPCCVLSLFLVSRKKRRERNYFIQAVIFSISFIRLILGIMPSSCLLSCHTQLVAFFCQGS